MISHTTIEHMRRTLDGVGHVTLSKMLHRLTQCNDGDELVKRRMQRLIESVIKSKKKSI